MKTLFLTLAGASLLSLAACQSTAMESASETRTLDVTGAQGRYTLQIPRNSVELKSPYTSRPATNYAPNATDR